MTRLLLIEPPQQRILNCGNPDTVSIREWVEMCYAGAGKTPRFVSVDGSIPQRSYFPFLNYAYELDVSAQKQLLPEVTPLADGLRESYAWYRENRGLIRRKSLMEYIDENLKR